MGLFLGTSGWAYKEWKPEFYPADLPQRRFLEHYAGVLSACEINNTFYSVPSESTVTRWAAAAPPGFRFSTKAHRGLTYMKTLAPDEGRLQFVRDFYKVVGGLGDKLGAVLFQPHPRRKRDDDDLDGFLRAVEGGPPFAIDFRHESWDTDDVRKVVADAGGTVCYTEWSGEVPDALPPGPIAYVRLRSQRYEEGARAAWKALLNTEATGRDVYAFSKHEGIDALDAYGGLGLARWLNGETTDA
ncbi:MAG: DUF72 domain-containing protein [Actinomycetota bacterium]